MSTNQDGNVNAESKDSQAESNPSPSQQQHATVEIGVEVESILGLQELQRLSLPSALVPALPTNSAPETSPSSSSHGRSPPPGWSFGSKHFPDLKVTLVTSKTKVGHKWHIEIERPQNWVWTTLAAQAHIRLNPFQYVVAFLWMSIRFSYPTLT